MRMIPAVARRGERDRIRGMTTYVLAGAVAAVAVFASARSVVTSPATSLTSAQRPTLAFLAGFGARTPADEDSLTQLLEERYEIRTVDLGVGGASELSPRRVAVLVVLGPTEPLSPEAAAAVDAYLEAGGSALLALEGNRVDIRTEYADLVTSGLEAVLEKRGLRVVPGLAYDLRWNQFISIGTRARDSRVFPYPYFPNADKGRAHSITSDLEAFSLGWPAALDIIDTVRVVPLWTTTEVGGRFTEARTVNPEVPWDWTKHAMGRQVLAVAMGPDGQTGAPRGRLVVVGDANFLDARFARYNRDNRKFVVNAVDWLAGVRR